MFLAFSALMTSGSPEAVVNVLCYYEMFWVYVYTITTVSSACDTAYILRDTGAGAGLLLRRNEPRALISRGLSSICRAPYTLWLLFS